MTKIDRTDQLLDILRQELAERIKGGRPEGPAAPARTDGNTVRPARPVSAGQLRQQLARELKSHNLGTPEGKHQARIAFIETVVAWDLGANLMRDPQFGFMVRHIEDAICGHATTAERFDGLLADLAAE